MENKQRYLIPLALFSGCVNAQHSQCLVPLTELQTSPAIQKGQIIVESDRADINQTTYANFEGKVTIFNDSGYIAANQARIDKLSQTMRASGDVNYRNQQIDVITEDININLLTGNLSITESEYRLAHFNGRGNAEQISLNAESGLRLEDVSFTTCPAQSEDWKIKASSISLNPEKPWGEATNTRFYIKDVPVFYLPYFAFPITNQRQTGFLYPEISTSSSTGLTYEQPFYWNIAPNYDLTFAPRLMTNRGLQLKTEARYLVDQHTGQINVEYLDHDKDLPSEDSRYFFRYIHLGQLSDNWLISANLNRISDDNYILDLDSDFYSRADTHLSQNLGLSYFSDNLDFSFELKDFELIGDHPSSYRALPELKLNYKTDVLAGFEFSMHSELAYFDNESDLSPDATRFHLAPTLSFPLYSAWGEFVAEASLLNTYYRQEDIKNTALKKEVTRSLGQVRLYGALNFERDGTWLGQPVTQTFEPKVQYLYTSYEDQSMIGLYDTTRLLNDFDGLFRGQEFTGLDRISDHNQVTLGATSRILDENNREQFKVSIGQIFYLSDNKVLEASKENNRSALAGEVDWQLGSRWFAHTEFQISTQSEKLERSSISLEYQLSDNKLVQLSHRYVRNLSGEEIDQVGITASWPIDNDWHWVGRWYKDWDRGRTIESYLGLQYNSCCWSVQLIAQRHLTNRFNEQGVRDSEEFDSSVNLRFSFKFGEEGRQPKANRMLNDGLFGYRQPYLLNK
ncbi:LPS assembly protein LptD [Aestuariibacter sp. AA17]|uniref:LPS-assembly protein LptD n=1 Tax=Fluctibacter corallii TaxID=2984329 RepID=A0ABT3A4J8_9ALTE|nr:LPS assembly protein LptD [Aestuariibacter sp. AA17]MCV2883564.1 LPS assembly protein LptD [Aestuariibacter sp. AA17]